MNQLDQNCIKEELDLFSPPIYQTSVEEGSWDKLAPLPGFHTNTLDFQYSGTDEYPDLDQTFLYLKVSIRKRGANQTDQQATPITKVDKIAPVNNFLHSLFRSATLYVNNTAIENTNDTYAYRAYIENLLSFGKSAKETHLQNALFYRDTPGHMDYSEPKPDKNLDDCKDVPALVEYLKSLPHHDKHNGGLDDRKIRMIDGSVELWGPLHIDMFNSNRIPTEQCPL